MAPVPQIPDHLKYASPEEERRYWKEFSKKQIGLAGSGGMGSMGQGPTSSLTREVRQGSPGRRVKREPTSPRRFGSYGLVQPTITTPHSAAPASNTPLAPGTAVSSRGSNAAAVLGRNQVGGAKRPASTSLFVDDRRSSAARVVKRESVAPSAAPPPAAGSSTTAAAAPAPALAAASQAPNWYNELPQRTWQTAAQHQSVQKLRSLKTAVGNRKFSEVLEHFHDAAFLTVSKAILRAARILHPAEGLPRIFDPNFDGGIEWPEYLKADAQELWLKWCRGVFDTDLLRGIALGRPASHPQGFAADKIKDKYPGRVDGCYFGAGDLVNGQWWPTQLCTVRDGAHNATIAGICGQEDQGTWSVIMSDGKGLDKQPYPDKDEGDTVLYCGTDATDHKPTEHTKRMLESVNNRHVRLIRSSNLKSKYAPEMGFRYDGLYDVVSFERLDSPGSERQRHQFKLVRCAGQDDIRATGSAKRPTKQEVKAHKDDRKKRGY